MRPRAVFAGSAFAWTAWSKFLESIRSGKSGVEEAFGETLFEYLKSHTVKAAAFNTFMVDQTAGSVGAILGAYSFAGYREFVDVGGGRGALVAGVLQANSGLRGKLFDAPEVVATADAVLQRAGISDRCEVVAGDFFQAVPKGADLYALKYILHDWSDEACVRILANCRAAMAPGGRVLIIEHVIPEESGPHFSKFMDLNMMVLTAGGRERTEREFRRMLERASPAAAIGFDRIRIVRPGM